MRHDDVVAPLRECLAPEDDVVLAYVFGSVARGRAGPLSDLDVAVLLADDADIGRRHLELIAALTSSIKSSEVDVVILNDAPVALAYRVLRDGRPIVNRNERVRVGHWVATVDRYLDMEPMRRMLAAGLQHRLEEGRLGRLVDPDAVRRRLREIDRRVARLGRIQATGRGAFVADPGLQTQAERHLQLAIQSAIDIALHIVAEDSTATPEDYGSSFSALAGLDVIGRPLAQRLRVAVGLRNVLVHAYLDVDPERIWDQLSGLTDLEEFSAAIEAYLSR